MRKALFTALVFLLFVLVPVTEAFSISPGSQNLDYEPGIEGEKTVVVSNDASEEVRFAVELTGSQVEYFEASEHITVPANDAKEITVSYSLPEIEDVYGHQPVRVRVTEPDDDDGMITTRIRLVSRIDLRFPYPGQYVEPTLEVPNINEGENLDVSWDVENLGQEATTYDGVVVLKDDGEVIDEYNYEDESLEENGVSSGGTSFNTDELPPGNYRVEKTLFFEDDNTSDAEGFTVGEELVEFISIEPEELYYDEINRVTLQAANRWNDDWDDVSIMIDLNGSQTTTPTFSTDALSTGSVEHYIDTTGLEPGNYTAEMTINFGDNSETYDTTVTVLTEEESREEEPSALDSTIYIYILLVLIILSLIVGIAIMLYKKER